MKINYFITPGINSVSIQNEFNRLLEYFRVERKDIRSMKKDTGRIRDIRKKICFLLYTRNYSYHTIKDIMNRKSHANILYHYKTAKGRMEVDKKFKQEMEMDYINLYNTVLSI